MLDVRPAESLKHGLEHRDPYNPRPVWLSFRGLFRAIDEGNAGLNIPAYNGGLFAADPALDALQVPDEVCAHFKELGGYDWRPACEVADADENTEVRSVIDVDTLGHIFDHTIREGNSIISDPSVHPKAFDWQAAFPAVLAQDGVSNVAPAGCRSVRGQRGHPQRANP